MAVIIDTQKALRALRGLRGNLQSALVGFAKLATPHVHGRRPTIGAYSHPNTTAMPKRKKNQGVIVLYDGPIARVFEGELHHEPDASGGHEFWTWGSLEREDSAFRYKVALAMPKMGARDHCCPFCASVDIETRPRSLILGPTVTIGGQKSDKWFALFCKDCHAEGPLGHTEEEAMRRWDSIVNRLNGQ